jgi:hypothetical protein
VSSSPRVGQGSRTTARAVVVLTKLCPHFLLAYRWSWIDSREYCFICVPPNRHIKTWGFLGFHHHRRLPSFQSRTPLPHHLALKQDWHPRWPDARKRKAAPPLKGRGCSGRNCHRRPPHQPRCCRRSKRRYVSRARQFPGHPYVTSTYIMYVVMDL